MTLAANVTYTPSDGLYEEITSKGYTLIQYSFGWVASDPTAVQSIIDNYDPLPYTQRQALATVAATLASRITSGFTYSGVLIACDEAAQGRISRVSQMAADILNGKITKAWTSRTWPPKTPGAAGLALAGAQDMIDMGAAVGAYVADNEFFAADLEAQILASTATATSIAALDLDNSQNTWPTS